MTGVVHATGAPFAPSDASSSTDNANDADGRGGATLGC